ncbi:MAG TPA: formylglycine-generating enzyme family protein, partial [Candidatus Obscuribacterales bacterium]
DRPQWTALACLKPSEAVEQIQQALKAVAEQDDARERIRLAAIVRNYANLIDPLERLDYRPLLVQWAKQATQNAIEIDGLVLHPFEYQVATLHPADEPPPPEGLTPFRFTVVFLNRRGSRFKQTFGRAYQFVEDLPGEVGIEMVAIPSGRFLMGSPGGEGSDRERPQHQVTVPPFFMGRYSITQAQWRAVAAMPKVKRDLKPNPSKFKGDMRPVERVDWHDAMEFCDRLSAHTGRSYSLPSEAEWEYACRAGTTTPFHFGATISPMVANYRGTSTYGNGSKGEYREKTTSVGHFRVANAFGLCDMHGNVWEWCLDSWHDNYKSAPTDGSAWNADRKRVIHVLRGGSWDRNPEGCRSACRGSIVNSDNHNDVTLGFRVVCHVRSTP